MEPCTVSQHNSDQCHKTVYTRKTGTKSISQLDSKDKEFLNARTNHTFSDSDSICFHHEQILLIKFDKLQRKCCDPGNSHPHKAITRSLRAITPDILEMIKETHPGDADKTVIGQKLCVNCTLLYAPKPKKDKSSTDSTDSDSDKGTAQENRPEEEYRPAPEQMDWKSFDETFGEIGVTPIKSKQVSSKPYLKRKVSQVYVKAAESIAGTLAIDPSDILDDKNEACQKCGDLEELTSNIKEKLQITTKHEMKVCLTQLAPAKWTLKETMSKFGVPERLAREAKSLVKEGGLGAQPKKRKVRGLSEATQDKVVSFYEDDDVSRVCPGMRDSVPVKIDGVKVRKTKRLLLANLKELHANYKALNPEYPVGLSKFCDLRPKWCVTADARGIHNVCVCEIHQNLKLMVLALPGDMKKMHYTEYLKLMVCDIENRDCMLHGCEECPGKEKVKEKVMQDLESYGYEDTDEISYKQWQHTDRTDMVTVTQQISAFVDIFADKIEQVTTHHYIAKAQAEFVKKAKAELKPGEMIVVLDFSQNAKFVVQDAVQGFHWSNGQATLLPYTLYYKENDEVKCDSLCIISDCLDHSSLSVYAFNKRMVTYVHEKYPEVKKMIYVSDGAASQFKNYKTIINMMFHEADYWGIKAEWHFFATSHGKNSCDGIGGTTKRLAAAHSLKATTEGQILSAQDLFKFAKENILGIHYMFVSKEEVEDCRVQQEERMKNAKTIPGTRSTHAFVPDQDGKLLLGRISTDIQEELYTKVAVGADVPVSRPNIVPGKYIAAVYQRKWYIGNVIEISEDNEDARIDFMIKTGSGKNTSLKWPSGRSDDQSWVAFSDILCTIKEPTLGVSGRVYRMDPEDIKEIPRLFATYKKNHC